MKKGIDLSIIIPVFYGEEIFENCLNILYKSSKSKLESKDWEILAYNNGFDPGRWKEIKEIYPKIKYFGKGKNIGFAKGNNFLLRRSLGEYILFLNQDVFIGAEMILELIKFLQANKEYSCVAPQLRYENGKPQYSCRPFPKSFWFLAADFLTRGKKYRYYYSPEESGEVDQPMASCLLFRGDSVRKLNGFDTHPHFFLYFNDTDLNYRLYKSGGKSYFLSSVSAVHMHGQSTSLLAETKRLNYWCKGLGRLWYKMGQNYWLSYFKAFIITVFWGIARTFKNIAE